MPSAFLLLFETTLLLLLLFRFFIVYLHFFKYNALSVGSATEGIGLPSCTQMSLLVVFVSPTLVTTMVDVLSGCAETSWFTWKKIKIRKHENMSHQTMFFSLKINTNVKMKIGAYTHTHKHKASVVTFILLSCDGGKKEAQMNALPHNYMYVHHHHRDCGATNKKHLQLPQYFVSPYNIYNIFIGEFQCFLSNLYFLH